MTDLRPRHLLPALMAALALHVAAAVLIFADAPDTGASGAGRGGLEVGMGLAGGAPGKAGAEAPLTEAVRAEPAAATTRETAVDKAPTASSGSPRPAPGPERTPQATAAPATAQSAPAVSAPRVPPSPAPKNMTAAAAQIAEPAQVAAPGASVARAATAPAPDPARTAAAEPGDTVTPTRAEEPPRAQTTPTQGVATQDTARVRADDVADDSQDVAGRAAAAPASAAAPRTRPRRGRPEPEPARTRRAEPEPTVPEPRRSASRETRRGARQSETAAARSQQGSDGETSRGEATGRGGNAGAGQSAALGGDPGARRDYVQRIAAILAREKRYPRRARIRRQEGTGHLRFTLGSSGRVVSHSIARSTGHATLDDEIAALLRRAAPLPPIPPELGRGPLEIIVPIRFQLR